MRERRRRGRGKINRKKEMLDGKRRSKALLEVKQVPDSTGFKHDATPSSQHPCILFIIPSCKEDLDKEPSSGRSQRNSTTAFSKMTSIQLEFGEGLVMAAP